MTQPSPVIVACSLLIGLLPTVGAYYTGAKLADLDTITVGQCFLAALTNYGVGLLGALLTAVCSGILRGLIGLAGTAATFCTVKLVLGVSWVGAAAVWGAGLVAALVLAVVVGLLRIMRASLMRSSSVSSATCCLERSPPSAVAGRSDSWPPNCGCGQ